MLEVRASACFKRRSLETGLSEKVQLPVGENLQEFLEACSQDLVCEEQYTCVLLIVWLVEIAFIFCGLCTFRVTDTVFAVYCMVLKKRFMFVTSRGWEVSEMMEDKVKISDMTSNEVVIEVRISHHKPKYGITIEGQGF